MMSDKVNTENPSLNELKSADISITEKQASFTELLQQEFDSLVPKKPLTAGEIVAVRNAVVKLLEQKIAEKQVTSEFLKGKAKTDIIHRSMWLMSNSEIDALNELVKEIESV